jgi:hypothetical protein
VVAWVLNQEIRSEQSPPAAVWIGNRLFQQDLLLICPSPKFNLLLCRRGNWLPAGYISRDQIGLRPPILPKQSGIAAQETHT